MAITISDSLPFAHGQPQITGRLRTIPEDFQVREVLEFSPEGTGEHVWLWVRKRNANTEWVARQLAKQANVSPKNVSYAGLKDRHAVTEQWFSVHLPGREAPDWNAGAVPDFTVLKALRHSRKLRRGTLTGNMFRIVVRELDGDPAELHQRLQQVTTMGVPNYFGEQRFGRDAGNLGRAEAMLRGDFRVRDRHKRGLYLSAARSALFNALLAQRVAEQSWNKALAGEVVILAGSHSFFTVTAPDAIIQQRVTEFDLHPSGMLWGAGELSSSGVVQALETRVAATLPVFRDGLAAAGLKQERRALRLPVHNTVLMFPEPQMAVFEFRLAAGAYATTVLRELLQIKPSFSSSNLTH